MSRLRASAPLLLRAVALQGAARTQHGAFFSLAASAARQGSPAACAWGPREWSLARAVQARGFAAGGGRRGGSDPSSSEKGQAARDDELAAAREEFDAITDKIPQKPVTFVEGTSYSLVIVAALGFAAAIIYAAAKELLLSPKEHTAFNEALERIRDDPRVTVRLGTPISAYGTESHNRAARQQVPHREYVDTAGREHLQIQFHLHGPGGRATVNADMYIDPTIDTKHYQYRFLYIAVDTPRGPQQVVFVRPSRTDDAIGEFV